MEASEDTKAEELKSQGNECVQHHKFDQAVELYTKALELAKDPRKQAIFLSNRALCHIRLEAPGFAVQDSKLAVKQDETYVQGYYRLGSSYMMQGHLDEAYQAFREAKKLTQGQDQDVNDKLKFIEDARRQKEWEEALSREETSPIDPVKIDIPSSYDGPQLEKAQDITTEWILDMTEYLKKQKKIHQKIVVLLINKVKEIMKKEASLINYTVPDDEEITICGDTHGQYYDLLNIFKLNGNPSQKNPYLFNGDFVDRQQYLARNNKENSEIYYFLVLFLFYASGSFSFEVIITLFAWQILLPKHMCLTRGNHECRNMNQLYGFEGEVVSKYDVKVFELFADAFCTLPLGYVINNKVMICHGGLFAQDGVKLDDIQKTDRFQEPPESGIMCDMLWADPCQPNGRHPSKRGVSVAFGPDIAHQFLDENNLEILVRSHEMKEQGYQVEADGRVITIFSAPNYCDQMGNKGAFIKFKGNEMKPQYTQFAAVEHPNVPPMAYARNMYGFM